MVCPSPACVENKWQQALGEYLQKRACLSGVVVLMDIRHPLKDLDMQMIEWAVASEIPVLACYQVRQISSKR